jgi:predicted MPP superfamily phosphohydrolase
MRAFLPIPLIIKNALGWFYSYYMCVFVYFLMYFIVADFLILFGSFVKIIPNHILRRVRFVAGLTVILLTFATIIYGARNANKINNVFYNIRLKENVLSSELKIVLISDLHLGAINSEKRLEIMVQNINRLSPDIVCVAGDIFNDDFDAINNPDKAINILKNISAKYGVYGILGNHDGGKTLKKMMNFLELSNIKLLNDESVIIDERFVLIGRLDSSPIGGFGEMSRKKFTEMNRNKFAEIILNEIAEIPIIVMDHNPANIGEYGNEISLILAGHTHKGQIFPGNLFTKLMFIVDYGHYQKNAESPNVIVTSGVSTWGMPMRVGTNNEIVSIILR